MVGNTNKVLITLFMCIYIPETKTKIRTSGTINFNKILNIYPKKVSPKLSFHKLFIHHPAIKHINKVLNGNKIFEVA